MKTKEHFLLLMHVQTRTPQWHSVHVVTGQVFLTLRGLPSNKTKLKVSDQFHKHKNGSSLNINQILATLHVRIYSILFMVYLTTVSIGLTVQRRSWMQHELEGWENDGKFQLENLTKIDRTGDLAVHRRIMLSWIIGNRRIEVSIWLICKILSFHGK
jgi:hypothetical protein